MKSSPSRRRAIAILVLSTVIALAACTAETGSTPSPSAPSTPIASPSATPTPSATPAPTAAPTVTWAAATVPDSQNASATITILPGGEGLVAIGFDGGFGTILWTSPDGSEWTDITPADFASIGIVSVAEFDGGLVGVGRGDTINVDANQAAVYRSNDGITWRTVAGGDEMQGQLIDVVATDDGLFAVGGVPGEDAAGIWRSADGETWERTGGDFEHAFMWAVAEGGPGLAAVGWRRNPDPDLAVWTSPDGAEWTLAPDPEGFAGFEATDVIDLDGTLVMVGSAVDGSGGQFWTSTDGVAWELAEVALDDGAYARSLARTPIGLVATGGGADAMGRAWISSDGRSWAPLGDPVPDAFFQGAHATDDGRLLLAGATQSGTLETGIQAHAMIWGATLGD
jgi:hypothetical protein